MSSSIIRTPDQRLRVFISSTLRELAAEREAAKDAITRLRLRPVLFEAGARPHPPRDLYRAYLEQSDIFIGIYGAEYGWIGPGMEISGLEDEYLLAAGKPKLIYIRADETQRDPRLKEMVARMADEGHISYKRFSTLDELRDLIENDVALLLTERFQTAAASPALGTAGGRPSTLPAISNRLIGREKELADIATLLRRPEVRLVTLSGPGGSGKTRLALEVAYSLCEEFGGQVQFVSLAPLREPSLVVPAIAEALGIHESGSAPLIEALKVNLSDGRLLLIIDNFEQVIDAAVHLSELLSASGGLKMLVTSRELLQLYAEHELPVPPLRLPDEQAKDESLSAAPAVELFLERSRTVRPDLPISSETLRTAALICAKLSGLPLAIELAAGNARFLPLRTILEQLDAGLDVLSRGPRDLPERQRTMRATLAWSYDLLPDQEQRLFQRLSVFSGGCSLAAVQAVVDPDAELGIDMLDGLLSLTTKSMLRIVDLQAGQPRFEMSELMREFGAERLVASGEAESIRNRHCRYFAEFAAEHEGAYVHSTQVPGQDTGMDYANWREALSWAIGRISRRQDPPGLVDALLRFLTFYWYVTGRLSEGRELSERAVRISEQQGDLKVSASALLAAGTMALRQSHLSVARKHLERSVALWRQAGDGPALSLALMVLGMTSIDQHDTAAARTAFEESLELVSSEDEGPLVGLGLMHLGTLALDEEDWELAQKHFEHALENQRRHGSDWGVAALVGNLGEVARCKGDYETASQYYHDALRIFQVVDAPGDAARMHHGLGYVALRAGDLELAGRRFREALDAFQDIGILRGTGEALLGLASLAVAGGQHRRAALLLGASERLLEDVEAQLWVSDRLELERDLASIGASLGSEGLARGIAEGREVAIEDAIEFSRAVGTASKGE